METDRCALSCINFRRITNSNGNGNASMHNEFLCVISPQFNIINMENHRSLMSTLSANSNQ